jgi:curved DNA-binding protein
MAIEYKDYYEILGIPRSAGEDEIRKAFRRLARVYHPDKAGNDRLAENRFKEINEAYEVLGDPGKRRRYDDFQTFWQDNGSSGEAWKNFDDGSGSAEREGRRANHFTFSGAGFSDFFEQLFGRRADFSDRGSETRNERANAEPPDDDRGDDLESDIWVSLEEAAMGAVRSITMRRAVRCPVCLGMGQHHGHSCERCGGKGDFLRSETYKVKIPKGIREGAFLRVPGRGEEGANGSAPGDLYLKVKYGQHPEFRVEHGCLVHDLELAPWEAVLGAAVGIPTLSGPATIKVPAGTRSGRKLRIKGRGLPSADGAAGDLIVHVKVQVPDNPGVNEQRLWQELARESNYNPRDN